MQFDDFQGNNETEYQQPQGEYRQAGFFSRYGLIFVLKSVLWIVLAVLATLLIVSGILVYSVTTATNRREPVSPQTYLTSRHVDLNFTDPSGREHEGWMLWGLPNAPVILLAHGYESNRAGPLALGVRLQQSHYNVYLFNFHPISEGLRFSSLGTDEKEIFLEAVNVVLQQEDINPNRLGVWGESLGGYAALAAAQELDSVRALVVDSGYPTPTHLLELQVKKIMGDMSRYFWFFTELEFSLLNYQKEETDIRENLMSLEGRAKFFIVGENDPGLAAATQEIFEAAPEPKELLTLEISHSSSQLVGRAEQQYEDQVVKFFQENLPLRGD